MEMDDRGMVKNFIGRVEEYSASPMSNMVYNRTILDMGILQHPDCMQW
jgi:hypothetical protein